jgi:hypothetical protein
LAPVLNHDINGKDARVDEIAEDEIDHAVLPPERHGWLGALSGERQ